MKPAPSPSALDLTRFAAQSGELDGRTPVAGLSRLDDSVAPEAASAALEVVWSARAERRIRPGSPPEVWLHLKAAAQLPLVCQRCLKPVEHRLQIDRSLRFVEGESQAERLDAELEEDVLALPHSLDLIELIEDEVLLALPLVPMHERCPEPLPMADDTAPLAAAAEEAPAHPFAALRALKSPPSDH